MDPLLWPQYDQCQMDPLLRLLVKINCSGWSLPRELTRVITISGIGIKSQLRQIIFFPVLSAINLKPLCRFPLGPSETAPFVIGLWLLQGAYYSYTWQYCPIWRLKCFLYSMISPVMMIFGLKVSEILPFVDNKLISFTVWNTMCIVNGLVIRLNGRPCRAARHCWFNTLIFRSILGTCSLALSRLIMGPPGSDSIRAWSGENYPSECTVVMRNQWCR